MVVSTGALQGKRLSSKSLIDVTLPVLSGSFIAGWLPAGFFFALNRAGFAKAGLLARPSTLSRSSAQHPS